MDYNDFVHPNHLMFFVQAAKEFKCHILVRKTGRDTISWIGKRGFTGKRGDLKAKTANQNFGSHQIAGLVCSPILLPHAFTGDRLASAMQKWSESSHLITVPNDTTGFDDNSQPTKCRTPYLVQTKANHKYYGCVTLVEMGLLLPRYVHGDYDLYAIIPAGQNYDPNTVPTRKLTLGSTMAPDHLSLSERLRLNVPNLEGALSFQVSTFINHCIERASPDLLGALMVNHGEQVNIGKEGQTFEPVLAIMPKQVQGEWARILFTRDDHEQFYRMA